MSPRKYIIAAVMLGLLGQGCHYDLDSIQLKHKGDSGGPDTKPVTDGTAAPDGSGELTVETFAGTGALGAADGDASSVATFAGPIGVAVDQVSGKVYVADYTFNKIRLIHNGQVSTVKTGLVKLKNPQGVAVDGSGNVYVADTGNNRVVLIAGSTVTILAGTGKAGHKDGPGTVAKFWAPQGIAVDTSGAVFVADSFNNRIRRVVAGVVSTVAGLALPGDANGPVASARFKQPTGLALDAAKNQIYVADRGNHLIRLINKAGMVSTVAGSGSPAFADGKGTAASFDKPRDVALDADGRLWVADEGNNRIRVVHKGEVTTPAGTGTAGWKDGKAAEAQFKASQGIAPYNKGGQLMVADTGNNRIRVISVK